MFIFQQNTSDHVRVKLLGLENIVVELKVKKHIPLENLKIAYSQYLVSINFYYILLYRQLY